MNKRFILFIISFVSVTLIFLQSCVKEIGKPPVTIEPPPPPGACDTITYTKHIKSIIDVNCTGCHAPGGSKQDVPLVTFAQVEALSARIKIRAVDVNASPMPPGGSISASQKNLVQCWIDNGKKEN